MIFPLICSPSPRDIELFNTNQDTIPCDKLLVKYHHAKRAYKIMRSYFLDNIEYTHLVIHPDDLIVNVDHYNALLENVDKYPILSGTCNLDMRHNGILAADMTSLPNPVRKLRKYRFVSKVGRPMEIKKVYWSGFPFMFLRRDVVEKIDFEDDTEFNTYDQNHGWGFDVMFCYRADSLGIPIHVDFRVFMKHLKSSEAAVNIRTGKTEPKIIQKLKATNYQSQDVTDYCNSKYLSEEDWVEYKI